MSKQNTNWSGEGFPPVGTICYALWVDSDVRVEILKVLKEKSMCACLVLDPAYEYLSLKYYSLFRPIKSDRDKAIDEADALMNKRGYMLPRSVFAALYDLGILKIKEDK